MCHNVDGFLQSSQQNDVALNLALHNSETDLGKRKQYDIGDSDHQGLSCGSTRRFLYSLAAVQAESDGQASPWQIICCFTRVTAWTSPVSI
jgi:hypothetical protein